MNLTARQARRLLTVLVVLVLPLTVGMLLLGSLQGRTDRFDVLPAAVVNDDRVVTTGTGDQEQTIAAGRLLAAGLTSPEDGTDVGFAWQLTDAEDAADGLADGSYAAVVTIPEDFSAAVSSVSTDDPVQATVQVAGDENRSALTALLAEQIAQVAATTMGEQVTSTYVDTVLIGFTDLSDQLTTAADGAEQAADGATALAEGSTTLADGATTLADGVGTLADGVGQAADGAGDAALGTAALSGGADRLASGASTLASGTGALADGAETLATGARQVADGLAGLQQEAAALPGGVNELTSGARDVAAGVRSVSDGAGSLAASAGPLSTGAAQTAAGAAQVSAGVQSAAGALGSITCPDTSTMTPDQAAAVLTYCGTVDAVQAALSTGSGGQPSLVSVAASVAGGAQRVADGAVALSSGAGALASGAGSAAAGAEALAAGTQELAGKAGALTAGVDRLVAGATTAAAGAETLAGSARQASAGAATLDDGAGTLASGAAGLHTGVSTLSAGVQSAATGAADLATGATTLAEGTTAGAEGAVTLSDGVTELADGLATGAEQVPSFDDDQRATLASVVTTPVVVEATTARLDASSSVAGPLVIPVALWLGALVVLGVRRAVPRAAAYAAEGAGRIALRAWLPAAVLAVAQTLVLMLAVPLLGIRASNPVGAVLVCALAAAVFTGLNQAARALWGRAGLVVSLAFLALQVASVGGMVPIDTAPAVFRSLSGVLPLSQLSQALDVLLLGVQGSWLTPVVGLLMWGVIATAGTVWAVRRSRSRVPVRDLAAVRA